MASINPSGENRIVVTYKKKDGSPGAVTKTITGQVSVANIEAAIHRAILIAMGDEENMAPEDYKQLAGFSSRASALATQFKEYFQPSERLREGTGRGPPGRRPGGRRPGREKPEEPPIPTINESWIGSQLKSAESAGGLGGDSKAQEAASSLHRLSGYVDKFLNPERKAERTEQQKAMTIDVFDRLYRTSMFSLLLSSQAHVAEYTPVAAYMGAQSEGKKTLNGADGETIKAADTYIRYFIGFMARKKGYERFKEELRKIPSMKGMLDLAKASVSDEYRMKNYSRPMDGDTMTAASLYLRRWHQENPKVAYMKRSQDKIAVWKAPKVLEIKEDVSTARGPRLALSRYAKYVKTPHVGFIGASLTAGGAIAAEFRRLFREEGKVKMGKPAVKAEAGKGVKWMRENFEDMRGFNIVVISGTAFINDGGRSVKSLQDDYDYMFRVARKRKQMIIVHGIAPFAEYKDMSPANKKIIYERYQKMDEWFKARRDIVYVDVNKVLGEPSKRYPQFGLKLKKQLEAIPADGLHPNMRGRNLIAQEIYKVAIRPLLQKGAKGLQRTTLEEFAEKRWKGLGAKIAKMVKDGRPDKIIERSRNIPDELKEEIRQTMPGRGTVFERALRKLKRDDIDQALTVVFNEVVHSKKTEIGREFTQWAETHPDPNIKGAAGDAVRMMPLTEDSSSQDKTDRRMLIMAMEEFINSRADETGGHYEKFEEDLKALTREVFHTKSDKLLKVPFGDLMTLCGVAVYVWRLSNKNRPAKEWARGIKGVTFRKQATTSEKPEHKIRRSGVIRW